MKSVKLAIVRMMMMKRWVVMINDDDEEEGDDDDKEEGDDDNDDDKTCTSPIAVDFFSTLQQWVKPEDSPWGDIIIDWLLRKDNFQVGSSNPSCQIDCFQSNFSKPSDWYTSEPGESWEVIVKDFQDVIFLWRNF